MSTDAPRDPVLPAGRFWFAVLGVYPGVTVGVVGPVVLLGDGGAARLIAAGLGCLVAVAILRDRQVRAMPAGWRAWWLLLGLMGWAAGALALTLAVLAVFLLVVCSSGSCIP